MTSTFIEFLEAEKVKAEKVTSTFIEEAEKVEAEKVTSTFIEFLGRNKRDFVKKVEVAFSLLCTQMPGNVDSGIRKTSV